MGPRIEFVEISREASQKRRGDYRADSPGKIDGRLGRRAGHEASTIRPSAAELVWVWWWLRAVSRLGPTSAGTGKGEGGSDGRNVDEGEAGRNKEAGDAKKRKNAAIWPDANVESRRAE